MECWICGEFTNKNDVCNCKNDYCYVHNHCIENMIAHSNKYECIFCKKQYKIRKVILLKNIIIKFITEFINFYYFICEYDLNTCIKWNDLYQ